MVLTGLLVSVSRSEFIQIGAFNLRAVKASLASQILAKLMVLSCDRTSAPIVFGRYASPTISFGDCSRRP
jgi:hypothetical protein